MINVPLPNKPGRIAILGVHAAVKAFDGGVNMERVARATAGFTGADLKNLLDRAALIAVMQARRRRRGHTCCSSVRGRACTPALVPGLPGSP